MVSIKYYNQFKDPKNHSWINPLNKIIKKKTISVIQIIKFIKNIFKLKGIKRIISISKIKKIILIKKNLKENGFRGEFIKLNPHSKGDSFSNSFNLLNLIKNEKKIRMKKIEKINIKININSIFLIT